MSRLQLRNYQLAHLMFHLQERRSLNLSLPGTGKTPTACVFTAYQLDQHNHKVVWSQPKSLLHKNRERRNKILEINASSTIGSVIGKILDLNGVIDAVPYENMTKIYDPLS